MGIGTTPGSRAVKELLTSLPWENFGGKCSWPTRQAYKLLYAARHAWSCGLQSLHHRVCKKMGEYQRVSRKRWREHS